MKPLFSAGEPVVIQSKHYPEYNNQEDIVNEVIDTGITSFPSLWREPETNTLLRINSRYVYLLQYNTCRVSNTDSSLIVCTWGEKALRKKHKPSDNSFESMMTELKKPIKGSQKLSEKTS